MKIKYILGILVSIFLLTNIASATIDSTYYGKTYVLDQDSESLKGVEAEYVTVTILDGTHVQFNVAKKENTDPAGYFKIVGLPIGLQIPHTHSTTGENIIDSGTVYNANGELTYSDVTYTEGANLDGFHYPSGAKLNLMQQILVKVMDLNTYTMNRLL